MKYKTAYPELGAEYSRVTEHKLAEGWEKALPVLPDGQADRHAHGG